MQQLTWLVNLSKVPPSRDYRALLSTKYGSWNYIHVGKPWNHRTGTTDRQLETEGYVGLYVDERGICYHQQQRIAAGLTKAKPVLPPIRRGTI